MLSRIEKYFNGELSEKEALEMQIWLAGHSDDPEVHEIRTSGSCMA